MRERKLNTQYTEGAHGTSSFETKRLFTCQKQRAQKLLLHKAARARMSGYFNSPRNNKNALENASKKMPRLLP